MFHDKKQLGYSLCGTETEAGRQRRALLLLLLDSPAASVPGDAEDEPQAMDHITYPANTT